MEDEKQLPAKLDESNESNEIKQYSNSYSKKKFPLKFTLTSVSIIVLLASLFVGGVMAIDSIERKKMESNNIEDFIKGNPKLVFKEIDFSKFVIVGKPDGSHKYFEKLNVAHLKGSADLYIELKYLTIVEERTDYISKRVTLSYDCPTKYPVSIDVNIPSKSFTNIESIEGTPISEEEADDFAMCASLATGTAGALAGGALGNSIGKLGGFKGQIIGALAGGVVGAGTSGSVAYVKTKNFLTGLQLSDNTEKDQIELEKKAKELIAVELLGGDMWYEPDYDNSLMMYYKDECTKQIESIMQGFGWKEVVVEFK